jgi:hypothetical protein
MIAFSITGDDALLESLRAKSDQLIERLRRQVDVSDLIIQQRAMSKVSGDLLQIRTGKLARSIVTIPAVVNGDSIDGAVEAGGGPAYYAKFQEDGTAGPYQIVAASGKALAFILDGKAMFRRAVMHPGLPAKLFMKSSLAESESEVVQGLQNAVAEVIAG